MTNSENMRAAIARKELEAFIYRYELTDRQAKELEQLVEVFTEVERQRIEAALEQTYSTKYIIEWWICTEFLAQGGKKVAGPFKSRATALKARETLETKKGTTFAVDSIKHKRKQKLRTVSLAQAKQAINNTGKGDGDE